MKPWAHAAAGETLFRQAPFGRRRKSAKRISCGALFVREKGPWKLPVCTIHGNLPVDGCRAVSKTFSKGGRPPQRAKPHIIILHKIVPAQSPRPRRQEVRRHQRCLSEKMARDESAIRLRGTGLHWAEAPRRRMKSSAETLSYLYPVCPPKLYANVQLWQSKFCVQRVDERKRCFAVSSGCCEQGGADRERRFAVSLTGIELLQPKNLPPEGFSGLRRDGSFLETFSLTKGFPKLICAAN